MWPVTCEPVAIVALARFTPNHSPSSFGFVSARQTRARGASSTTCSSMRSLVLVGASVVIIVVLSGEWSAVFCQVALQRSEPAAPELPVRREPRVHVGERLGAQAVHTALRVDSRLDESRVAQHTQVL